MPNDGFQLAQLDHWPNINAIPGCKCYLARRQTARGLIVGGLTEQARNRAEPNFIIYYVSVPGAEIGYNRVMQIGAPGRTHGGMTPSLRYAD